MDLCCLDTKKKAPVVSKTQHPSAGVVVVGVVVVVVVRCGRRTTTTRRRARKKSGEIETGKRRGRGSGEERARRVVAWAAFFRERKGKDSRSIFIFSSPNFPSLLLNAHRVLRETIARTLPLWEEHRRRRWVPGGETLREAGERDERRGTEWSRRSDGDDGHRGGCHGASDGGIIIICAKETIESNFRERGGEKTHGRASVETKTRRDEEEQQTDEREREQVERRE